MRFLKDSKVQINIDSNEIVAPNWYAPSSKCVKCILKKSSSKNRTKKKKLTIKYRNTDASLIHNKIIE